MAGRKLTFDPSDALRDMMMVFWTKGYNGTSLDDLCHVVGVPKPSLYSYFGDKETILIKALELYGTSSTQRNEKLLFAKIPLKKRLTDIIVAAEFSKADTAQIFSLGCLLVNMATEFMGISKQIDSTINSLFKENEKGLKSFLDVAIERKELDPKTDTQKLALQIDIFIRGLAVSRKAGMPLTVFKEQVEDYISLLLG